MLWRRVQNSRKTKEQKERKKPQTNWVCNASATSALSLLPCCNLECSLNIDTQQQTESLHHAEIADVGWHAVRISLHLLPVWSQQNQAAEEWPCSRVSLNFCPNIRTSKHTIDLRPLASPLLFQHHLVQIQVLHSKGHARDPVSKPQLLHQFDLDH